MSIIHTILSFVLLLGVLVLVHELGHFLVARWLGVTVEIFSIGFGKRIASFKRGSTEYRISLIPMGGFVKMFGDNYDDEIPPEDCHRAFIKQSPYKKILIAFAGPFANVVLAVFVYMLTFMIGVHDIQPKIGFVLPNSPAEKAGLLSGDKIINVNKHEIIGWGDFVEQIAEFAGKENDSSSSIELVVERKNQLITSLVQPKWENDDDIFGQPTKRPMIGVTPQPVLPILFIESEESLLATLGVKSGDLVTSVNNINTPSFNLFIEILMEELSKNQPVNVVLSDEYAIKKSDNVTSNLSISKTITLTPEMWANQPISNEQELLHFLGCQRGGLLIREVTAVFKEGDEKLLPFDKILTINEKPLYSAIEFENFLNKAVTGDYLLTVLRSKKQIQITVPFAKQEVKNSFGMTQFSWNYGFTLVQEFAVSEVMIKKIYNPFVAVKKGIIYTFQLSKMTLKSLYYLFSGSISKDAIGGPLTIAKIAGESMRVGILSFLNTMALISINLALINLFPIPVLDGGHILMATIEAIYRRPIHKRILVWAYGLGFWLIMSLMVFSFYTDVDRFGMQILTWFKGLFN